MSEEENKNQNIVLPTSDNLIMSSSPHLQGDSSVRKIMLQVIISLLPASLAGVYFFGIRVLWVILFTVVCCVGLEALWCVLAKKPVLRNISDGSAVLTGLLLALNLPPSIPFYACLIGSLLAIWLGKQIFGGLGNNPFNPALVARVGLLIALPAAMTTWDFAKGMPEKEQTDAISCATPLGVVGTTKKVLSGEEAEFVFEDVDNDEARWNYFLGRQGGCIGETSTLALLIGGLFLIFMKLINWRVPLLYIGSVAIFTGIVNFFYPGVTPTPLFHIVTGGLVIGAFFMATDMVTSPVTNNGCVVFAIGCGIITSVIRIWGNYPEGVSFAILFMNALVPLIDRWCKPKPFGYAEILEGRK